MPAPIADVRLTPQTYAVLQRVPVTCHQTGAHLSQLRDRVGWFVCGWCAHAWAPTP